MIDFLTLVKRDHHDLECSLDALLLASTASDLRTALDSIRLGLMAHAEAEDIVLEVALSKEPHADRLRGLIAEGRSAHLTQERALSQLVSCIPGTPRWKQCATSLRDLIRDDASYEEAHVIPAIRELAPDAYAHLAGEFATERLRQLAMLQPSAVYCMSELALAG